MQSRMFAYCSVTRTWTLQSQQLLESLDRTLINGCYLLYHDLLPRPHLGLGMFRLFGRTEPHKFRGPVRPTF